MDGAYGDLVLHSEVGWLSRGEVLNRFLALLPEIVHFPNDIVLREEWTTTLAFLADITVHLNKLNLQLRKHVGDLLCCIEKFKGLS